MSVLEVVMSLLFCSWQVIWIDCIDLEAVAQETAVWLHYLASLRRTPLFFCFSPSPFLPKKQLHVVKNQTNEQASLVLAHPQNDCCRG